MKVVGWDRLEDEGYRRVVCVDMSAQWIKIHFFSRKGEGWVYLANSKTASVVSGVFSFFTSSMFFGGEGHRRDRRSLPFDSASVSKRMVSRRIALLTVIARLYAIWKLE